jgi:hypothetical protein
MYIVYRDINNIKKLKQVENKEVKAKRKYIAEQSAKIIYNSLPSFNSIEV